MFRKAVGSALRKRLYPNTALQPKVLAAAINRDVQTVYNNMNERNGPDGDTVDAYIEFFVSMHDYGFVTEIFPGVLPLVQRKKEAEDALVLVQGIAKLAAGVAA